MVAFLYVLTEPEEGTAITLMRAFTAARVAHTIVYAVRPVRQPARAIAFTVGLGVTGFMAARVVKHFCSCAWAT